MNHEVLRKLRRCQLDMLEIIDLICKKYQLTYFLVGGSLLGAVRHNGYIPWDDDLDVGLPRKDYEEFIRVAQREKELMDGYFIQTNENDVTYPKPFAKIRKYNTAFVEEVIESIDTPHEIYVDIFPIDTLKALNKSSEIKARFINNINFYISNKKYGRIKQMPREYIFSLFPDSFIIKLEKWLMAGKDNGEIFINYAGYGYKYEAIQKKYFLPVKYKMFEGKQYPIPNNSDYILRHIFGEDYMELPPISKRVTHNPKRISFDTDGQDEVLD